jgi:PDZ domain-containing protein
VTRLLTAGALLAAVVAALFVVPTDKYIFLPDEAHTVEPIVEVEGEKPDDDGGGIHYLDVLVRKATLIERVWPGIRSGSTLVPPEAVRPPGVDDSTRRQIDLRQMANSQDKAAAVALRELGYDVEAEPRGALVTAVYRDSPAVGHLKPSDVIVAIDGARVRTLTDVRRHFAKVEPGERVALDVRDGKELRKVHVRTIASPDDSGRAVIGVLIQQAAEVELPLDVAIDAGRVGGPSAGLAFALDILEELGRPVDRGHKIAVTGEIELDGTVGPVGGIKQKTIGARESGMDVLLVPAGDNAREARRYAGSLRVMPVNNFDDALRQLATLPTK